MSVEFSSLISCQVFPEVYLERQLEQVLVSPRGFAGSFGSESTVRNDCNSKLRYQVHRIIAWKNGRFIQCLEQVQRTQLELQPKSRLEFRNLECWKVSGLEEARG